MDCGPTCLKMVAKYYGKDFKIASLHRNSGVSKDGVSLLGISQAAEKIGFNTYRVKLTLQQLYKDAPKPAILHWSQNHFVVLFKTKQNKFYIADPTVGLIKLSEKEFSQSWIQDTVDNENVGIALLLEPTITFYERSSEKNEKIGWYILMRYLFKYKASIVQLFLGLLIGTLLQLVFPYLTQSIVDIGINTNNLQFIQLILIAQFTLFFARAIVEFIRGSILLFLSTHINLSILSDFWIKLMRLPLNFFDTKQTGDILQRINDHHRIENFITYTALQTFFAIFNLIIFAIVLLTYNMVVFFVFITGSALYLLWILFFLKYRRSLDYKHFSLASKENSVTMQLIHGMQEIKLNNAEFLKRWEWEDIQSSLFKLNFKSLSLTQYQQAGAIFINQGKDILITYIVAKAVLDGQITLGGMLAIQYIVGQLTSPVEQLITFTQQAQDAKISLERLNEIHDLEDEEPFQNSFISSISGNHSIKIRNLSFAYPGSGSLPVLRNINLDIPESKVTAIVGMSGSGKTSLLKLLQHFYNNYEGNISIGSTNLNNLSPNYLRSVTGTVMQDGYIFSDTIANNIAIGDENPDKEKLITACKIANILDFIETLPLGLNTKIGAEGNGLSQGQKQRILIARAVYKDPKFIFLDEATNALDANNEKIIMRNLQDYFLGKTVIIVAHRLSTVKNADKIVVLDKGVIDEEGTHEELTFKKGKYYSLIRNQLELGN